MRYERIKEHLRPSDSELVRFKAMGNVSEIFWSSSSLSTACNIRKLDKDNYVDLRTGEVMQFEHTENRAENLASVRKSLQKGRDLLNTNITDVTHCRWVCLTYAENMTDTKRLYKDTKNFIERMRKKVGHFEYIIAAEPQGRGAWHNHMVMIFADKAPFIPNAEMASIWGHGFVKVKKLDDVDNVGAYLTAYLGDMEVSEAIELSGGDLRTIRGHDIKEVEVQNENGEKVSKRYIKGGRLYMYPPQFHIFRWSKGIKEPDIERMVAFEAEKKVSAATLTYENTLQLSDEESGFQSVLNYRYYNMARRNPQETKTE